MSRLRHRVSLRSSRDGRLAQPSVRRSGGTAFLGAQQVFDRALRTVKEYHEKVEYIHMNPVRAGLVRRTEDWAWSSVHDYVVGLASPPAAKRNAS